MLITLRLEFVCSRFHSINFNDKTATPFMFRVQLLMRFSAICTVGIYDSDIYIPCMCYRYICTGKSN